MNVVIHILIIIFLLILQFSFLNFVLPFYLAPNIILSVLVCNLLFTAQIRTVLIYSFFVGVLMDLYSGNVIVFPALYFLLIIFLLVFLQRKLAIKSGFGAFLFFLIIVSLLYNFLVLIVIKIDSAIFPVFWSTRLATAMFGGVLANLIFGSPIYFLWRKIAVKN